MRSNMVCLLSLSNITLLSVMSRFLLMVLKTLIQLFCSSLTCIFSWLWADCCINIILTVFTVLKDEAKHFIPQPVFQTYFRDDNTKCFFLTDQDSWIRRSCDHVKSRDSARIHLAGFWTSCSNSILWRTTGRYARCPCFSWARVLVTNWLCWQCSSSTSFGLFILLVAVSL